MDICYIWGIFQGTTCLCSEYTENYLNKTTHMKRSLTNLFTFIDFKKELQKGVSSMERFMKWILHPHFIISDWLAFKLSINQS